MNFLKKSSLAVAMVVAACSIALAQAQPADGKGCTPQERSNKALEHDQSNSGVICPPEINSGTTTLTPNTGDAPVATPPGNHGDAPGAELK